MATLRPGQYVVRFMVFGPALLNDAGGGFAVQGEAEIIHCEVDRNTDDLHTVPTVALVLVERVRPRTAFGA